MHTVTAPLAPFDRLVDLERSRALHQGTARFDLEGLQTLLQALPQVEDPRASIHVAGSEGKTSVTERCAAGLAALGLSVGTFTSPHLHDPLERLRLGLELPPRSEVAQAVAEVQAAMAAAQVTPTWFEALWATARLLFARHPVEATVWETGLGGRLDATRLSPAHVTVITSVSLEHTAVLGSTLAEVAGEKAGILRPGVPVLVAADLPAEALAVFAARAEELGCPRTLVPPDDGPARGVNLAQAALRALAEAGRIPAVDARAKDAVASWQVTGRDQVCGDVHFDGSHSLAAVQALAGRLAREGERAPVVLGITHGRDGEAMARALQPVASPLILCRAPGPRGLDPAQLARVLPSGTTEVVEDPVAALARARVMLGERSEGGRRIVVTGSLYLVGTLLSAPGGPA
jgi:dihydrofolate synthase/folylpolyglutamate synthase